MSNEVFFLKDKWLSECLGAYCYALNNQGLAFDDLPKSKAVFITAKVRDSDFELSRKLLEIGFRDINRQVTYRKELNAVDYCPEAEIRLPSEYKILIQNSFPQFSKFSFLFEFDRFTMDKSLPPCWSAMIKGEWMNGSDSNKRFVVVYADEEVAGFILFSEGTAYIIELLCVLKEYRGKGLARSMLSLLERLAREKLVSNIVVGTQKENPNSTYVYQSSGFVLADEQRVLHYSRGIELHD
ncbi:MAG: GNAT family N-acetyltransferase [Oceanospirillaceae bacterium]|nr:GNAT family N-acetyltransferase [Oceanospirillaceae bacterium]